MYQYRFELDRVVDGDTIDATIDLGFGVHIKRRVRLSGINAPETRTRDPEEKAAGLKAKDRLIELLTDQVLTIHTQLDETGKFGRVLGVIYNANSLNINLYMLDKGLVMPYGQKWGDTT